MIQLAERKLNKLKQINFRIRQRRHKLNAFRFRNNVYLVAHGAIAIEPMISEYKMMTITKCSDSIL